MQRLIAMVGTSRFRALVNVGDVAGRATFVCDDGEMTLVTPGTCVSFPAGWTGHCTVHETIRNIYMLVWGRR